MKVIFRGTRGSVPVSGEPFRAFGGNTVCIEVHCGKDVLIFDAGSGLPQTGKDLWNDGRREFQILLTHCHYDHMIGLPYFMPLYDAGSKVTFWSGHMAGRMSTEEILREFVSPPWFPVELNVCRAALPCKDFRAGDVLTPYPGVTVQTGTLNHPGGAIGYRVDWHGHSMAMITDTEHVPGVLDPEVLRLIEGVDLFLYDATYLEDEMGPKKGYGHSTWVQAVKLARAAGAKRIALIHHAPWRTDEDLLAIDRDVQAEFPEAFSARDGQVVEL